MNMIYQITIGKRSSLPIDRLTCSLLVPKQPTNGTITIDVQPTEDETSGSSDISGSVDYHEKFYVYVNLTICVEEL